jgi:hypothetical protein
MVKIKEGLNQDPTGLTIERAFVISGRLDTIGYELSTGACSVGSFHGGEGAAVRPKRVLLGGSTGDTDSGIFMKRFLVIHYSQSGQLNQIVRSFLGPLLESEGVELVFEELRPVKPYPFPWTALEFADAFPESLEQIPCELQPFRFNPEEHFDGVILAYQVWYLSPSIPISTFLQSAQAARAMRGRPVITVIGCRNMWLLAHEKVKRRIFECGGIPAANVVLMDRAPNLLGVVSIAAWMLTGKKERFLKIFPRPGVSDAEIAGAHRFGTALVDALSAGTFEGLQASLNAMGAVTVVPDYILFEHRIAKIFKVWATFIRAKGGPGDPQRRKRLRGFIVYLLTAVFLLAPIATAATAVLQRIKKKKIEQLVIYFKENRYDPVR